MSKSNRCITSSIPAAEGTICQTNTIEKGVNTEIKFCLTLYFVKEGLNMADDVHLGLVLPLLTRAKKKKKERESST